MNSKQYKAKILEDNTTSLKIRLEDGRLMWILKEDIINRINKSSITITLDRKSNYSI